MKKIISLFMSILMLMLCVFQINVLADENAPMIIVESVSDSPGATVDVAVKVKNNPGIHIIMTDRITRIIPFLC